MSITVGQLIEKLSLLDPTMLVGAYAQEDVELATGVTVVDGHMGPENEDEDMYGPYYKGDSLHFVYGYPKDKKILLIGDFE